MTGTAGRGKIPGLYFYTMAIHIRTCADCGLKFLHASAEEADAELAKHLENRHGAERPGTRKWWDKLRESDGGGFSCRLNDYDKIFLEGAKIGL